MHFMPGPAQCQATGEQCFIVLTAHFSSLQTKLRTNAFTNAAEGIFRWNFSMLAFEIMLNKGSLFSVFTF